MKLSTALNTKTSKTVIAGALLAGAMSLGVSGTASASQYGWNDWNENKHHYGHDKNTCEDSFWAYNRQENRWYRVGYNEHSDRWEVCRRSYNDNHDWYNNHNDYDDRNWDRDNKYWDRQGRYENDDKHHSSYGRRDY